MATAKNIIRILMVEDHLVVRAGLRMLIENSPRMEVVGMVGNRSEALAMAAAKIPDLILLDLDLGKENGLEFLADLHKAARNARVLVLTGVQDIEAHRQAARLGAMGVVLKEHAPEVLIKAIEKVHSGEAWLDRSTMARMLHEMTQAETEVDPETAKIASLSEREREVIKLIAEGLKNKQIAERLFICETTVTHHLSAIFSKLDVSDRLELAIYAFSHKLAKMPRVTTP